MRLLEVELIEVALELLEPVHSAAGDHHRRPVLLVHLRTEDAEGYGECAALVAPTYTAETIETARLVLSAYLLPALVTPEPEFSTTAEAMVRLGVVRGHPMAKAALEMALLDAELRAGGRSLADELGATRRRVPAGATVGDGPVDSVVHAVGRAVDAGYTKVKCKITPGDLEGLRAVRVAYPELALAADANGSFDLGDADVRASLVRLDELGLAYLEQPGAVRDLVGHARLAAELTTPVVLDESVESRADLETALALSALDGLSMKPARVGGLRPAVELVALCRDAGLHLLVGGMFEAGIGRAASLALSGLDAFDLPGDLGGSDRYYARDLVEPFVALDGMLEIPAGPGLGVEVDERALAELTVSRWPISPGGGR